MTSAQYLSSIISLSMVLGFFATSRLNRLPSSVTILLTSIVLSLILVSLPQNYLSMQITNITIDAVKQGDFRALLIDGLLSFLLFAGAVSLPFEDIKKAGVDVLTLGQYMRPTINHLPVEKWYTPEEFEYFKKLAVEIGFLEVASGPMVRSSYRADRIAHLI